MALEEGSAMTREEVQKTLQQAQTYGGYGLIEFFDRVLDHDQAQRDDIRRLRALLVLLHNELRVQSSCWALERSNQIEAVLKEVQNG